MVMNPKSKIHNLFFRICSSALIVLHLTAFGPIREVAAFTAQSANFKLTAGLPGAGGLNGAAQSFKLDQGIIGEPVIGKSQSAYYILNSGYVSITESNPPVLNQSIPSYYNWAINTSVNNTFDLDDYFSSPEGYPLIYTVSGNSNIQVNIDPATHMVSFSSKSNWSGVEKVYFYATDSEKNMTMSNEVVLQVQSFAGSPNKPVIVDVQLTPQIILAGSLVKLVVKARDLDNQDLVFNYGDFFTETRKWKEGDYWYSESSWQTGASSTGHYNVNVTVKDMVSLSDTRSVLVNVGNVNHMPVLSPILDITAKEGDLVTISPQASDQDNDAVTYYFESPFDMQGRWLSNYESAGTYNIKVIASDGIDTVSQTAKVIVNNTNRSPLTALSLSKYTLTPNEEVAITFNVSDPDSDTMTFILQKDAEIIASGPIADSYSKIISFSTQGYYKITAKVTDSGGLVNTVTKDLQVTVKKSAQAIMGDYNGDSLTDLGMHDSSNGNWEVCLSQGGIFESSRLWLETFGNSSNWSPVGGDFNGDGKSDIGIYNYTSGELKIALSNGSSFISQPSPWVTAAFASYSWQPFIGNFNGDKYSDFGLYNKDTGEVRIFLGTGSGFSSYTTWVENFGTGYIALGGDFNGDSLTDLCLFKKSGGESKVAFSNTNNFVDGSIWITGFATGKDPVLSDFNNDGLTDVGYWDKPGLKWYYAISTGSKFVNKGTWFENFGADKDDSATTGDFDGNGITDAATFDADGLGITRWSTNLSLLKPADLLNFVDNGIGGKTQVIYTYAAKADNGALPFPVYVASSISLINTTPIDRTATYTQTFKFAGGYYDSTEREFRGFQKVTVSDPVTCNFTETYFYQGKPDQEGALKGQIEKMIAYNGNSKLVSQTTNIYEVKKSGPEDNVLGFPALKESITSVYEATFSLSTKTKTNYDNIGNLVEQIDEGDLSKTGDEKSTLTTYAQAYSVGFNRPTETVLKDSTGAIVSKKNFEYDQKGNLYKELILALNPLTQDSQLITTSYAYDSFGNLTLTTNPKGGIVTTLYETIYYAYPEKITNALGQSVSYIYEPKFGVIKSVTDTNGNISTSEYDTFGRVLFIKNAYNQIPTTYSYPDFNTKITTQTAGTSTLKKIEYVDGLGRKYRSVSLGEDGTNKRDISSEIYYNNRGLTEKESLLHYVDEPQDQISYSVYEYDILGRIKKTKADFPGTLKDAESSINYIEPLYTETIDPLGHRKGTRKDINGNVIDVTEFTQGGVYHTYYTYDVMDNLVKTTDSKGNISQIFYDSIGRKIKMIDPDMGTWSYEYDVAGNLTKQTDAKSQVLTFEYDVLNRLIKKSSLRTNGASEAISQYIYDEALKDNCIGRLSKVIDQSGSTEFFYDKLGREIKSVKSLRDAEDGEATPYTVQREYDVLDRLTKLTYPDGEVVSYSYDTNSGLLESLRGTKGAEVISYVKNIAYNAKGQIKTIQYGNNVTTNYTYGQDLRLSQILTQGSSTLQNLNYDFDKNGNLITLTDNIRSNIRTYKYDNLDRLTDALNVPAPTGGYTNFSFQYDSIGNMTYKSDLGVMTYGLNAGPHALTSAGGYAYQYDRNGNMIVGKNKTMEYDFENRLTKVNQLGIINTFVYDGDGGRVKKTSLRGGAETISTTYIGSLFEKDSDGKIRKHIFAGANKIASVSLRGSEAAEAIYYHSDHLGSSNVIANATGQQIQYCEYTPYGTLARNDVIASPEGANQSTNYLFTGKELDSTGLYFYSARYYDPEIGRFISADTIVQAPYDPQSLNRYSYCRNNPINYIDPTGHSWFSKWWGKLVGAIAGVVATIFTGNMMVGFQLFNFFSSLQSTITTGSCGAFAGGIVGGLIGGYAGGALANNVAGVLGENAFNFGSGFLIGATEMGVGGFGGSFGGALGGGASFGEAIKQGVIGLGIGAAVGGLIEGSYLGGMQNIAHGMSRQQAYQAGIKRIHALSVKAKDKTTAIVGSRPLGSADNPGFFRHRYIRGQAGRFEMGPDERTGLIELNAEGSFGRTEDYINNHPNLTLEASVTVSQSGFNNAVNLYKAAWVGTPYEFYNCNSNFAVNSVIYGAGANAPENLGATPIGIDHYNFN